MIWIGPRAGRYGRILLVVDDGELEMTPAARVRTLWSATDS